MARNSWNMAVAPTPPALGDLYFNAASGMEMVYNGTAWVPIGRLGVTDGSNAPAGLIGETKWAQNTTNVSATVAQNDGGTVSGAYAPGWVSPCSLPLAAGDWDVSGTMVCTSPATVTRRVYGMGALGTTLTGPTQWPTGFIYFPVDPPQESWSFFVGVEQYNFSAPTTVYLLGRLTSAGIHDDVGKTGVINGVIYARRMR